MSFQLINFYILVGEHIRKSIFKLFHHNIMQKLIFPIDLKPVEIITGVFNAINRIFNVTVDFTLNKKIWFLYYRFFFITSVSEMDYYKKREVSSITNISSKNDVEKFSALLCDQYVEQCLKVIYILTKFNTPYTLMESVKCEINELPETVLNVIKHINATKFVKRVEGTDKSVFSFRSAVINFVSFDDITTQTKDIDLLALLLELNHTSKLIGLNTVKIDSLNVLFTEPSDFMDISIYASEDGDTYKLHYGENYDKSFFRFFTLFQPKYKFDDDSIFINNVSDLTKKQVYDEVTNPDSERMFRKAINYLDFTLTDILLPDVSLGKINKVVDYKPIVGNSTIREYILPVIKGDAKDPTNPPKKKQPRGKVDKVKALLDKELGEDRLNEDMAKDMEPKEDI